MRFNVFARTLMGAVKSCLRLSVLPTLSPNPSLAQRAREGGQQPHLILSLRRAFYSRDTQSLAREKFAASQPPKAVASGALAVATKPNVAVRSPFLPRWGGKGAGGIGGAVACPLSPPTPLSPGGQERGAQQPHLILSRRLAFYWRCAQPLAHEKFAACQPFKAVASGALAGAKKPNVAVRSPFLPRWGGKGAGGIGGWSLPTLSPNPSLAQRAREGGQQPHLISSLRLAFYGRGAQSLAHAKSARSQSSTEVASGALAVATKPNVAVRSPFLPRRGGKGAGGIGGAGHASVGVERGPGR